MWLFLLQKEVESVMEKYQIDQFVEKTKQQDKGQGLFELETERILEINLGTSRSGQKWGR